MNVVAVELGERPVLYSQARRFAPEGVKLLAELLGHMGFADDGIVVLDWSNQTGRQPAEVHKPVVFVTTLKHVGEKTLTVEVRLDVEETFGNDTIVANDLLTIVRDLERKTLASLPEGA